MFSLNTVLLTLLAGLLDRYRGDDDLGWTKTVDGLVYGAVVGGVAFGDPWLAVAFAPFFAMSIAVGYGGPWGAACAGRDMRYDPADHHFYQVGVFKENVPACLALRAFIGGLIIAPFCFFVSEWGAAVAVILGFFAAPYAGRFLVDRDFVPEYILRKWKPGKERWNTAEFLRGVFITSLAALGGV